MATQTDCPFFAAGTIKDPRYFVGRKDELHALTIRMSGAQPTSINVTGERRIGKSSLLYHFVQTWRLRGTLDPARYLVVYLNLQEVDPQTEAKLYRAIAAAFLPILAPYPALLTLFDQPNFTRDSFAAALKQCAAQDRLPVLCLDEFEMLLNYQQHFDNTFYDKWRGLTSMGHMMLIASSRKTFEASKKGTNITSSFLNDAHVLPVAELSEEAAQRLVQLPLHGTMMPFLSTDEQATAREWGQRHPYMLHLAGYSFYNARQLGKDKAWAKLEFDRQADRLPRPPRQWSWLKHLPRTLFLDFPRWLGRWPNRIGGKFDDLGNTIMGWAMIVLLFAIVKGWQPVESLVKLILSLVGIGDGG